MQGVKIPSCFKCLKHQVDGYKSFKGNYLVCFKCEPPTKKPRIYTCKACGLQFAIKRDMLSHRNFETGKW